MDNDAQRLLDYSPRETVPLKLSRSTYEEAEKEAIKAARTNRLIIFVSIGSVVVNLLLSFAAFVIATMRDSAATYAFAADCLLDMLSSTILLWRFFSTDKAETSNRERKACVFLGTFFVLSGIAVILKAGVDISQKDHPVTFKALNVLSLTGTAVCLAMAAVKYVLAKKAESASLLLDAVNSVISGLLASVIILSDITYRIDHRIWFLEPLLSIILSALLVIYGFKVIYDHRGSKKCVSQI